MFHIIAACCSRSNWSSCALEYWLALDYCWYTILLRDRCCVCCWLIELSPLMRTCGETVGESGIVILLMLWTAKSTIGSLSMFVVCRSWCCFVESNDGAPIGRKRYRKFWMLLLRHERRRRTIQWERLNRYINKYFSKEKRGCFRTSVILQLRVFLSCQLGLEGPNVEVLSLRMCTWWDLRWPFTAATIRKRNQWHANCHCVCHYQLCTTKPR